MAAGRSGDSSLQDRRQEQIGCDWSSCGGSVQKDERLREYQHLVQKNSRPKLSWIKTRQCE